VRGDATPILPWWTRRLCSARFLFLADSIMALRGAAAVPLDLEATYNDACQRSRL
jgi:hypothetical protein